MRRWITYYLLSVLLISLVLIGFIFICSKTIIDGFFILMLLYSVQYLFALLIGVLQIIILVVNYFKKDIKLKFLIALSCVYSVLLVIMYGFNVKMIYSMQEVFRLLAESDAEQLSDASYNTNPFIGKHTFFIVPFIIQVCIFIVLYRKKKAILTENL